MYRPTVAEIDLTAIRDNLRAIPALTPSTTQVVGVVKADAYGDGAVRVATVVGRVSMDVCALDITDIPAAMPGDGVTLIGEQDGLSVTAQELGELMGTISYEVLTGISKRVPRVYIDRSS
jgi:alanine racemase